MDIKRGIFIAVFLIVIGGSLEARNVLPKRSAQPMKADLLAFSYDRPMQLYALLESVQARVQNLSSQIVIYRASSDRYNESYNLVKKRFPFVTFYQQGSDPERDFKVLFLRAFKQGKSAYILFSVDDDIVKTPVDIATCISYMTRANAYVFALRLGANITRSYMLNKSIKPPVFTSVGPDILSWRCFASSGSWHYAHSLDFSLYRKAEIRDRLELLLYKHPNSLEGKWSSWVPSNARSLCFTCSKVCGLPINIVHQSPNRNMDLYSTDELLEKFEQGLKIDIGPLSDIEHCAPHIIYSPTFILRGEA